MALPPDPEQSRADQLAVRRAAEQEVLLREVDEAMRKDQLGTAAKRYGWAIGGAVVLGLAAFGGYLYWDASREERFEANS